MFNWIDAIKKYANDTKIIFYSIMMLLKKVLLILLEFIKIYVSFIPSIPFGIESVYSEGLKKEKYIW